MYMICGKVKETEKTLFFNCIFCHTERTLACSHCHGPGKERGWKGAVCLCKATLSSIPQLPQLFARVSSGNWCFGSSYLQGTLVGPGCPAATRSLGQRHSPPACASICPKSLHGASCRHHPLHPLQDSPSGMAGRPGAIWRVVVESKGAVSRAKCSTHLSNILCCHLRCHFET